VRKTHLLPGDLVRYATGADVQATGPRVEEFRGEEALLGAFMEVSHPVELTVCPTQGHGEPRMDDLQPFAGYAHLNDLLRSAALTVQAADLDTVGRLQACDIVLVAGPTGPLPRAHVEAIERYAEAGGDLLLLTGAVVVPGARGLAHHGLEPLTRKYGIEFGERLVVDPHPMPGATSMLAFTLVEGWGDHPAVRALVGQPVSLVFVRELQLEQGEDGQRATALVQVGEDGWAEADIAGIRSGDSPAFDAMEDEGGPIPVAAAAERGGSRLVVIASDQFALNAFLREDVIYDFGRDLVLNAIGWLADRDVLLGIRPRSREHIKLVLLDEQLQRMVLVCLLGLPGFGLGLGLWVLWRRRR
jgi:ABC-2 type transport system permease protein